MIKYKKGSTSEEKEAEPKSETQPTILETKLAQRREEKEQLKKVKKYK